jgi:hypothetical protein
MSRTVQRLIFRCALVAIALGAAMRWAPAGTTSSTWVEPFWRPASVAVPAGLRLSGDPADGLVAAVTADIDADGDLDVVATDRALNLLIWVNDGTGRLTRQRPRQAGGVSTSAPGPSLERRVANLALSTLNDPPSARLGHRPQLDGTLPSAPRPPTTDSVALPAAASHRPSRAPPLTTC